MLRRPQAATDPHPHADAAKPRRPLHDTANPAAPGRTGARGDTGSQRLRWPCGLCGRQKPALLAGTTTTGVCAGVRVSLTGMVLGREGAGRR